MPKKKIIKKSPLQIVKKPSPSTRQKSKPKTKKKSLSLKTKLLFLIGTILVVVPLFFYMNESVQLMFFTPIVIPIATIYPLPTQISIPKINLQLPIDETTIIGGIWSISPNGASHLSLSARPGENGPIILYGHNTTDRFGPIRWLRSGDKINILTKNNKTFSYTIVKTMDVSPTQLDVFTQQKGESLILYTCDGFADLQRFVVIAKPL
ncbi:MAG TPA: sortase [Candidatus Saccharimonadales bacterium]|nr:sortase [Candidatus Saccharimonadales bacterium]